MPKPSLTELVDQALKGQREANARTEALKHQLLSVKAIAQAVLDPETMYWFDEHRWDVFVELHTATTNGAWDEEIHEALEKEIPDWREFAEGWTGNDLANSIIVPNIEGVGTITIQYALRPSGWSIYVNKDNEVRNFNKPRSVASVEKRLKQAIGKK